MKRIAISLLIIHMTVLALFNTASATDDHLSVERGKKLFNDPGLGTTGKSCNDCHPNGKGAEKASGKNDGEIARIVNACITYSIKGRVLEVNSAEMRSLILYIRSLGDITKPVTPKKAPVGC